jgi:ABC-type nickel/cobalt efflux system permease component RcnA
MESLTLSTSMAFIFGVLHALEPGHGKTALLTYVASGQRTYMPSRSFVDHKAFQGGQ